MGCRFGSGCLESVSFLFFLHVSTLELIEIDYAWELSNSPILAWYSSLNTATAHLWLHVHTLRDTYPLDLTRRINRLAIRVFAKHLFTSISNRSRDFTMNLLLFSLSTVLLSAIGALAELDLAKILSLQQQLPECSVECIQKTAAEHNCTVVDLECQCSNMQPIIQDVTPCFVRAGCGLDDIASKSKTELNTVRTVCYSFVI